MQPFSASLLVLALLALACDAHAEKLYRWVDRQGKVTYQDHPPPKDAGKVEEKELGDVNIVPPSAQYDDDASAERGERRETREKPRESSRPNRRNQQQQGTPAGGLAPDDLRGVVAVEDVPASVISPGGDAAGSAKPGAGSGAAASSGTAGGAATAPGGAVPPPPPAPAPF